MLKIKSVEPIAVGSVQFNQTAILGEELAYSWLS